MCNKCKEERHQTLPETEPKPNDIPKPDPKPQIRLDWDDLDTILRIK